MSTGPLFILIAAVLWGLDGILRRSLYGLPPASIVFYEHLIGAMILLPVLFAAWRTRTLTFSKREWGALGAVALFSGLLGTLFFTEALARSEYVSFSVVFLIQKLQPVFAILGGFLILKERVNLRYLFYAGLALLAGFFVTFPGGRVDWGEGGAYVTAALFAFLAAVLWGSSTALSRYALLSHSSTTVTALRFLFTLPLAFMAVLALGHADSLTEVSLSQLGTLFLIAFSTGMLALWVYYRGLAKTPTRISAIIELAFPMTAIFIDYYLYNTTLAWSQYAAVPVLLFAMYMVARGQRSGASASRPEGAPVAA